MTTMQQHTLPQRHGMSISEKELQHKYCNSGMSTDDIACEYKCTPGAIMYRLKKYDIPTRTNSESHSSRSSKLKISLANTKYNISEVELREKYCNLRKSTNAIAKEYGCDTGTILHRLRLYNIPRRKPSDYPHTTMSKWWKEYHQRVDTSGKNSPSYGRKHTPEAIAKIKAARANQVFTVEQLARRKLSCKMAWDKLSDEDKDRRIKACIAGNNRKPTKPEHRLWGILNSVFPNEWQYTGNGSVILNGRNPDFVNTNGKKLIIELFGTYWHGRKVTGNTPDKEVQLRREAYAQFGYNTLIIWENELTDHEKVLAKIDKFSKSTGLSDSMSLIEIPKFLDGSILPAVGTMSMEYRKTKIPKYKLEHMYSSLRMPVEHIASKFHCSIPTIRTRLREYEIPIRNRIRKDTTFIPHNCTFCGVRRLIKLSNLDSPNFTGLCFSCAVARRPMQLEQKITEKRKTIRAKQIISPEQIEKQRNSLMHFYETNPEASRQRKEQIASLSKMPNIVNKRRESRKGYTHSAATRVKMSISIKEAWAKRKTLGVN